MSATISEFDIDRAVEIWAEYQQTHDLSDQEGRAAGINPVTGEVFLGESMTDIAQRRWQTGDKSPLYFVRIGSPTYWNKGGRS